MCGHDFFVANCKLLIGQKNVIVHYTMTSITAGKTRAGIYAGRLQAVNVHLSFLLCSGSVIAHC